MDEQGQAERMTETRWEYIAHATGRVIVEAQDLPGNSTQAEIE
jgi:hypothetical protein